MYLHTRTKFGSQLWTDFQLSHDLMTHDHHGQTIFDNRKVRMMITRVLLERVWSGQLYLDVQWRHKLSLRWNKTMRIFWEWLISACDHETSTKPKPKHWQVLEITELTSTPLKPEQIVSLFQWWNSSWHFNQRSTVCHVDRSEFGPRRRWSDDEIRRDNSILDSENSSLSGRDKIGFIKNQFSLWGHNKACNELIIIYLDKTFQNVTYHLVSQSLCQFIESWCR